MAAANAPPELASGNPCCLAWQGKYMGMRKRRDAFKEAVTLLQKAIADANAEKSNLEKKLGEMVADRDTKENGSTVKASLEKEISGLKSEILSLQQKLEQNLKETKLLHHQASSREKEINELKELLKKETLRADNSEEEREHAFKELNKAKALIVKDEETKPHVPEVKKEISLVKNLLASERQKTESERKKAESEKKKADQYLSELEMLRTTAHKTSSDLLTLTSNLETVKKQLEFEKQKALKEKKRADMESAKAREQMKLAEGLSKKFETVRARNEELKKEMESQSASSKVKFAENSVKLEETIRLLEMNKKSALDWKSRADDLTQQLQETRLVTEGLKKQVQELSHSQESIKTRPISPQKVRDLEKAKRKLLKKQLKFERNCAKHSNKVAEFEKFQREYQAKEIGLLKLEFGSFENRMNLLDEYFSTDVGGTAGLKKTSGSRKLVKLQSQMNCNGEKHCDGRRNLVASSGSLEQARKFSPHLIAKSGRGVSESVSGTTSQLESPTGGSRKLQSSGVISSATSFSDGQLLASQGKEQFSLTTSAEIAKDKPNVQPTKSSMFQKISDTAKNVNLCLVAEKYRQRCRTDSDELVDENSRKRKRLLEAVVSRKHLSSDDKKKNLQIGEKMGTVQSMVAGTGYRPLGKEGTLVPERQGGSSADGITVSKKRRVSAKKKTNSFEFNQSGKTRGNIAGKTMCLSTAKGHDATTLFPEDVAATDYMKLLELDNLEEESYYQMARESLLSPDLPQVDFLGEETVNEDKNPARALDLAASNNMGLRETIISSETPSLNTPNDLVTVTMPPMLATLHGHILQHFVVFSNIEDRNSVIKIFRAANNCVHQCPEVTTTQWAVPAILSSLKMEENLSAKEIGLLKLEFGSFENRMNLLDEYFSTDVGGTAGLKKTSGSRKLVKLQSQMNCNGEKHCDGRRNLVASSGSLEQARKFSPHLIAKSGRGVSESVSGTTSQLESPTGGSRKLQSSGVISSATSFSDGQLLASQGKEQFSLTTSAEIAKDKPNVQPTKSSMFQKISDTAKNVNLCLVAEKYRQRCRTDSDELVDENSRKRKRLLEAVVSRKHLSSDDKKKNLQIGEKMGTVQSMVAGTGYRPLGKEGTLVPERQGGSSADGITVSKKRRVSAKKKTNSFEFNQSGKTRGNIAGKTMCLSTAKGHDATTLFPEDVAATDYMKLLELDNLEEESYYQMARESLLSPDLPQVDFLGEETVNEDKNPARALDLAASNNMGLRETIISSETPSLNTPNDLVTVTMPPMLATLHGHILQHFVVFSNIEDRNSVIKIFRAANNCVHQCPEVTTTQWAVPAILSSLKMEENLSAQERVCVFLSLLLHNFSVISSMKMGNTLNVDSFSCMDSFSKHIYGVMADIEAGIMLSEISEELLALLQDFLSEQRVLSSVKSSETSDSNLSIPVTFNGENIALVSKNAPNDHLMAGSTVLAAVCTALDRTGYICEASFEILHKHSHENSSVLLTILHVFAYIAGDKMVSSTEHDLSIEVLKSIVMFLENRQFSTVDANAKLHSGKNKCPFSDRSSSLEAIAYKLMEILQEFTQSNTLHQSLTEFSPAHKDFQCVLNRDQSINLCDILSLVELIACYTAWDWTRANIVAPLLKMLGMQLPMNLSVAIVSLLGQLSSIGVDAGGYENEGISNLRVKLSAFLQCETTLKAGFAVQIATVSSLLKTIQLDLPTAFQGKTTVLPGSHDQSLSGSVNLVTNWISLLSDEQRGFASEFLQNLC